IPFWILQLVKNFSSTNYRLDNAITHSQALPLLATVRDNGCRSLERLPVFVKGGVVLLSRSATDSRIQAKVPLCCLTEALLQLTCLPWAAFALAFPNL
uniref:Uncharacterized protein n=1 Tax=Crocodylus porosus TaxID=8502 RepID=A0A7M4E4C5_CROPO